MAKKRSGFTFIICVFVLLYIIALFCCAFVDKEKFIYDPDSDHISHMKLPRPRKSVEEECYDKCISPRR